jgi:hypothetical protein
MSFQPHGCDLGGARVGTRANITIKEQDPHRLTRPQVSYRENTRYPAALSPNVDLLKKRRLWGWKFLLKKTLLKVKI